MNIDEFMTRDVRTCGPSDTLDRAARAMWERDCGVLPVVDAERRVIGMITDRDVCMAAYLQGLPLDRILVSSVASHAVAAAYVGESTDAALAKMRQHRVKRLPVLDPEGKIAGVVSLGDLARHHRGGWGRDAACGEDIARTVEAIAEPRGHADAAE